uniref:Uncharacterized protein n=1 Tax=Tanacetum cinerariifolium TaxID=118510 RepID=A0A6L2JYY9_TANCI|nr:hypothetical protein [Tanacetum cinerariifolium]
MVLHQGYLLGGSYHGHDSIFLLNCYGVRWLVEVKQTYANAMSIFGPVRSDFMNTMDLFIKNKECKVFIGKIPSVNHLKTFKLDFYGPAWWSMMDELAIRPGQYFTLTLVCKGKFSLTVFNNAGQALTACENYASYMLWDSNFHIGQEPAHIKKLCRQARTARIYFSGWSWLDLASGIASGSGFIFARTQVWRMESYALKFANDVLLGIFAWGKPVWIGINDVLLLAPVLKHVVPSLVA